MRWTTVYWETKNGTLMELSEMTDSHIKNCVALIEKSIKAGSPWRQEALSYLKAELIDRNRDNELCEMINSQYDSDD